VILTAGTFFGFGWSAPEEAHAALGDIVAASSIAAGDIVYYGNYPQADLGKVGSVSEPNGTQGVDWVIQSTDTRYTSEDRDGDHYFKIEPIAWKVLQNATGKLFLRADKAIDNKKYNETVVSMTWEKSTARSWLNGYAAAQNTNGENYSDAGTNFITKAFTSNEQAKIATTENMENPANPEYPSIPGGENTTDKIFYLKYQDVIGDNAIYFTDNNSREAQPTDYAVAMGAYVNSGNAYWWLRSPGSLDHYAAFVTTDGSLNYNNGVNNPRIAVRPAFYLETPGVIFRETETGVYNTYLDLKTLTATGTDASALSPTFSTDVTEYAVTVPYATDSITLGATADSLNATSAQTTIDGTGEEDLDVGENEFPIELKDPDGDVLKTYTVTVTREKDVAAVTTPPAAKTGLTYTGAAQALVAAGSGVTGGTLQYKLDSGDYSTDIPTATNAGDYIVYYKVVATDTENYDDSEEDSVEVSIGKADNTTLSVSQDNITYGETVSPEVTGAKGTVTLRYKLKVANDSTYQAADRPTDAGTYTVQASDAGTANYNAKTATDDFTINKATVSVKAIAGVTAPAGGATPKSAITGTAQYTGTVTWSPTVSGTFAYGTAYTATITLTPTANYTLEGVEEDYFTVAGADATNAEDSGVITAVFPATAKGTGAEINAFATKSSVTHNSITISAATVQSPNTGGQDIEYAINEDDEEAPTSGYQAGLTFTDLDPNTDYYIWARTKENANYSAGAAKVSAAIKTAQINIDTATITAIGNQTYTGSAITPEPEVKDGTATLEKGTDYTVSYSDNTDAGTATVTVTGTGNYTGTKEANFTINQAGQAALAIENGEDEITELTKQYGDGNVSLTASGGDGTGAYSWSSSKEEVAAITGAGTGTLTIGDVGTATITLTKAADNNYTEKTTTLAVTVSKRDVMISYVKGENTDTKVYDGSTDALTALKGTYTVNNTKSGDNSTAIGVNTGTANFADAGVGTGKTVTFAGFSLSGSKASSSYSLTGQPGSTTADITKAAPTYTAPTAKTGLNYTGSAQELVTAGSSDDGEMQYKLDSGNYGTSIPTATDVGDYTVKYKVVGDANHTDSVEESVTVSIINTDATLSNLSVSPGTLSPAFASGTEDYTVSVPNAVNSITLTATKADANATVSGDVGAKSLSVGPNTFTITVTAEDASVTKDYTVIVTRAAPDKTELKSALDIASNVKNANKTRGYTDSSDFTAMLNALATGENVYANAELQSEADAATDAISQALETLGYGKVVDYGFENGDSDYTKGSDAGLKHRTEKDLGLHNVVVKVDGKRIADGADYTAVHGSTVVQLKTAYLDTLSVGKHKLVVEFVDGKNSESEFTILAADSDEDDDDDEDADEDDEDEDSDAEDGDDEEEDDSDSDDDLDNNNNDEITNDNTTTGDDITALWLLGLIASAALISLLMVLLIRRKARME
jgi:hypothetical protein